MSENTRELIGVLLGLAPAIAFVTLVVWYAVVWRIQERWAPARQHRHVAARGRRHDRRHDGHAA